MIRCLLANCNSSLVSPLSSRPNKIETSTPLIALGSTTTKLISKIGPYLELVNYFFGILFIIVSVWLLERILSLEAAAYLWTISAAFLILILFKSSKLLNNLSSKIVVMTLSALSIFYIGLQTYGIINNNYYEPTTSLEKGLSEVVFWNMKNSKLLENHEKGI